VKISWPGGSPSQGTTAIQAFHSRRSLRSTIAKQTVPRMPLTDPELVERALGGDQEACRLLVARHQAAVYNLIARMLRHPALAQDLAQETFLRAFSHLDSFDPRFRFVSWILRIAHNLAVDVLRRKSPEELPLEDPDPAGQVRVQSALVDPRSDEAGRELERDDLARALERALARLRPDYRKLLVLRYHHDLSHEELAAATGLPVGTVKSYLHRARAEMARLLGAAGWGPATRGDGET
jgi:RNA polymerase sigma-70 factor (ECF subfamily)